MEGGEGCRAACRTGPGDMVLHEVNKERGKGRSGRAMKRGFVTGNDFFCQPNSRFISTTMSFFVKYPR
jgi:hypothetical protein